MSDVGTSTASQGQLPLANKQTGSESTRGNRSVASRSYPQHSSLGGLIGLLVATVVDHYAVSLTGNATALPQYHPDRDAT